MVSTAGVIALALHVPGRLDLMIKGALAGRTSFGKVVLCVTKQIDTIIAVIVNMMILFIMIPFGIKHELLHTKGILILAKVITTLIRLYRTGPYPHLFFVSGR